LRKRRIRAATMIEAVVRGRNVRGKVWVMHESARKIQRTWRAVRIMFHTQAMALDVLVRAKLIKEEYLTKHALVIQRCYRAWRRRKCVRPIRPFIKAVITLQSHWRRRKVTAQVAGYRKFVGTQVKRFIQKVAVLYPDVEGHMTRARDVLPDDNVKSLPDPLRLTQLVDIPCMSIAQCQVLEFDIAPIQAMAKFQKYVRRITDIQRVWRSHAARSSSRRRGQQAVKIQAAWRAKLARNRFQRARIAATKIQAHARRMVAVTARENAREEQLEKAFAAIVDMGEDVVQGVRIRAGGSVAF